MQNDIDLYSLNSLPDFLMILFHGVNLSTFLRSRALSTLFIFFITWRIVSSSSPTCLYKGD